MGLVYKLGDRGDKLALGRPLEDVLIPHDVVDVLHQVLQHVLRARTQELVNCIDLIGSKYDLPLKDLLLLGVLLELVILLLEPEAALLLDLALLVDLDLLLPPAETDLKSLESSLSELLLLLSKLHVLLYLPNSSIPTFLCAHSTLPEITP